MTDLTPSDIINHINGLFPFGSRQWDIIEGPWGDTPYVARIITVEDDTWLPVATIVGYRETVSYLRGLWEDIALELGLYD